MDRQAPVAHLLMDGQPVGLRVWHADTWWRRARGLLATRALDDPCGLWLAPCSSVHMVGMRYPIDVAFLGRDGTVLKVVRNLRPWRAAGCLGARSALELRAGLADALALERGIRLGLGLGSEFGLNLGLGNARDGAVEVGR